MTLKRFERDNKLCNYSEMLNAIFPYCRIEHKITTPQ